MKDDVYLIHSYKNIYTEDDSHSNGRDNAKSHLEFLLDYHCNHQMNVIHLNHSNNSVVSDTTCGGEVSLSNIV